jgi:transcription initiation factor IIF auxiliary subunit
MLIRHHTKAQPITEAVLDEEEQQVKEEGECRVDEGAEEEVEGEAQGRADKGEGILVLVEQMEREDEEAVLVDMEGDDSGKERDPVPTEWSQTRFIEYI